MVAKAWFATVIVTVGCDFTGKGIEPVATDAALVSDVLASDTSSSTIDACSSFSTQFDTCVMVADGAVTITGDIVYDTDTHLLTEEGGETLVAPPHMLFTKDGQEVELWNVEAFTIEPSSVLHVVGSKSFGIVATGAITISGRINGIAGSRMAAMCGMTAGADAVDDPGGAPGGGGGGFQGNGGDGGQGDANGGPTPGAVGGTAEPIASFVRGGCPGGSGAKGGSGSTRVPGGSGGGGFVLVSAVSITVDGAIDGGGRGGDGGKHSDGGGGGGGSGGMIVLEAPSIMGTGRVGANGGGGGGGDGDTSGDASDGNDSTAGAVATGGARNGAGSPGTNGSFGTMLDGVSNPVINNAGGGGGGGGAAGYIKVLGSPTGIAFSPPPS